jgi:hypothetical protein
MATHSHKIGELSLKYANQSFNPTLKTAWVNSSHKNRYALIVHCFQMRKTYIGPRQKQTIDKYKVSSKRGLL